MARVKTTVRGDEVGYESSRKVRRGRGAKQGGPSRGGAEGVAGGSRRPQTASYRKAKQAAHHAVERSPKGLGSQVEDKESGGAEVRPESSGSESDSSGSEASRAGVESSGSSSSESDSTESEAQQTDPRGEGRSQAGGSDVQRGSTSSATEGATEPEVDIDDADDPSVPFPGGPSNKSLLLSFKNHVAVSIWNNQVFCTVLWFLLVLCLLLVEYSEQFVLTKSECDLAAPTVVEVH